jgi:hypothetical protein
MTHFPQPHSQRRAHAPVQLVNHHSHPGQEAGRDSAPKRKLQSISVTGGLLQLAKSLEPWRPGRSRVRDAIRRREGMAEMLDPVGRGPRGTLAAVSLPRARRRRSPHAARAGRFRKRPPPRTATSWPKQWDPFAKPARPVPESRRPKPCLPDAFWLYWFRGTSLTTGRQWTRANSLRTPQTGDGGARTRSWSKSLRPRSWCFCGVISAPARPRWSRASQRSLGAGRSKTRSPALPLPWCTSTTGPKLRPLPHRSLPHRHPART